MSVLLFFIDGLGLGRNDPEANPAVGNGFSLFGAHQEEPFPLKLQGGGLLSSIDANLGVDGLPQSATGQVTLLTGINAAQLLGRHLPAFPNVRLRHILKEHSLLLRIKQMGMRPVFINTFRPIFFTLLPSLQWRLSTTTVATLAADVPFFSIEDIERDRSIYHDFTNQELIKKGFAVKRRSSEEAASVLAGALENHDFILYEHFLTDRAGHARDLEWGRQLLTDLDRLLLRLVDLLDRERHTLLVTSDHGNLEDLSIKTHTRNPVPLMLWGKKARQGMENIHSIQDISPFVLDILGGEV